MAEAIISGLLKAEIVKPEAVIVSDPAPERRNLLQQKYAVSTYYDNLAVVERAEIIVLAVKPQIISQVLAELSLDFPRDRLLISIAAGVTLRDLEQSLPHGTPIIRAVPNTPCLIGEGITALAVNQAVTPEDLEKAERIFQATGEVLSLPEKLLDAVTAVSGSGPAYVYLFIEALIDGGVKVGLPRELARKLAVRTVLGSAKMVHATGKHPAELKDMVTSPGGTTIAALFALEQGNLRSTVMNAVLEAEKRAKELSHN